MMQMVRILKTGVNPLTGGPQFTENFYTKEFVETGTDENGNPVYEEKWNIPQDEDGLREAVIDTLKYLQKQRLQKILDQYGYSSLGDVQIYASQNDTEAQAILNFYTNNNGNGYDDLIWDYIDNLINKTYDELLQEAMDLYAVEEQIYQQALENNPLP